MKSILHTVLQSTVHTGLMNDAGQSSIMYHHHHLVGHQYSISIMVMVGQGWGHMSYVITLQCIVTDSGMEFLIFILGLKL